MALNGMQRTVRNILRESLKKKKVKSIILIGQAGCGKTYIARKYIRHLVGKGIVDTPFILEYPDEDALKQINKNLAKENIYMIDELRQPFLTPAVIVELEKFITVAYERGIPFVLIFNDKTDFNKLSKVAQSKLLEIAEIIQCSPNDTNFRAKKIEQKKKERK